MADKYSETPSVLVGNNPDGLTEQEKIEDELYGIKIIQQGTFYWWTRDLIDLKDIGYVWGKLAPNPAGFGFTRQAIVDNLPVDGAPNVLYLVKVYNGDALIGYRPYRWTLIDGFQHLANVNIPDLKTKDGGREQKAVKVNEPRKVFEKVFNGNVGILGELFLKGKKIEDYIDSKGGVTEEELAQAIAAVKASTLPYFEKSEDDTVYSIANSIPCLVEVPLLSEGYLIYYLFTMYDHDNDVIYGFEFGDDGSIAKTSYAIDDLTTFYSMYNDENYESILTAETNDNSPSTATVTKGYFDNHKGIKLYLHSLVFNDNDDMTISIVTTKQILFNTDDSISSKLTKIENSVYLHQGFIIGSAYYAGGNDESQTIIKINHTLTDTLEVVGNSLSTGNGITETFSSITKVVDEVTEL